VYPSRLVIQCSSHCATRLGKYTRYSNVTNSGSIEIEFMTLFFKNAVFWDVAPCEYRVNRRFGGTYRLHIQGRKVRELGTSVSRLLLSVYDSSQNIYTAPHPRNVILRSHRRGNLISYVISLTLWSLHTEVFFYLLYGIWKLQWKEIRALAFSRIYYMFCFHPFAFLFFNYYGNKRCFFFLLVGWD
jgi:hypothetical protein